MNVCPKCKIEFMCEIAEGRSTCWCVHVEARPHIPLHELDEDNCLCKDCLTGHPNSTLRTLLNTRKEN